MKAPLDEPCIRLCESRRDSRAFFNLARRTFRFGLLFSTSSRSRRFRVQSTCSFHSARRFPLPIPMSQIVSGSQLQATRGPLDYSAVVLEDATWGDLDPPKSERFRRFMRESPVQGDEALLLIFALP
jgi:hypothetical protein